MDRHELLVLLEHVTRSLDSRVEFEKLNTRISKLDNGQNLAVISTVFNPLTESELVLEISHSPLGWKSSLRDEDGEGTDLYPHYPVCDAISDPDCSEREIWISLLLYGFTEMQEQMEHIDYMYRVHALTSGKM